MGQQRSIIIRNKSSFVSVISIYAVRKVDGGRRLDDENDGETTGGRLVLFPDEEFIDWSCGIYAVGSEILREGPQIVGNLRYIILDKSLTVCDCTPSRHQLDKQLPQSWAGEQFVIHLATSSTVDTSSVASTPRSLVSTPRSAALMSKDELRNVIVGIGSDGSVYVEQQQSSSDLIQRSILYLLPDVPDCTDNGVSIHCLLSNGYLSKITEIHNQSVITCEILPFGPLPRIVVGAGATIITPTAYIFTRGCMPINTKIKPRTDPSVARKSVRGSCRASIVALGGSGSLCKLVVTNVPNWKAKISNNSNNAITVKMSSSNGGSRLKSIPPRTYMKFRNIIEMYTISGVAIGYARLHDGVSLLVDEYTFRCTQHTVNTIRIVCDPIIGN